MLCFHVCDMAEYVWYVVAYRPHCSCLKLHTRKDDEWIGGINGLSGAFLKRFLSMLLNWNWTFRVREHPWDLRMLYEKSKLVHKYKYNSTWGPTEPQSGLNDSLSVSEILGTDGIDPPTLCPSANPTPSFLRSEGVWTGGRAKRGVLKGTKAAGFSL